MIRSRRCLLGLACVLITLSWLWYTVIVGLVYPDRKNLREHLVAPKKSNSWGTFVCENVGLCGNWDKGGKKWGEKQALGAREAPNFVLEYMPYVFLHSNEKFMPGDIGEHLMHTTPWLNYTPLTTTHPLLSNLDEYNKFGHIYLTSDDDPANPPEWLRGDHNRPNEPKNGDGEDEDIGMSSAPGIIIWTEKGEGIVDAFYFYFYSFNQGNTVAGWRFGNHVGDWEHTAIRFINGQPTSMFFSEHAGGAAYEFSAVEKMGKRPVSYSARGSHANYATPGPHYYAIPFHLLADHADAGDLWDISKNNYIYHYNLTSDVLTPDLKNINAPIEWFHYEGRWGDRFYPMSDSRQYRVVGQYHYVNGPTGPKDKNMDRIDICQNPGPCIVQPSILNRQEKPVRDIYGNLLLDEDDDDVDVEFYGKDDEQAGARNLWSA